MIRTQASSGMSKEKNKMQKKQQTAIIILVIALALSICALIVVKYISGIFSYTDVDGMKYKIQRYEGRYTLYDAEGKRCLYNTDNETFSTHYGTQLYIDPDSGEYEEYAFVVTEKEERVGTSGRVLLYPQMTYDATSTNDNNQIIKEIEVHNEFGSYIFRRNGNSFDIVGHERTEFSPELFAALSNACGYTLSSKRLEDPERLENGDIDYSEYGLVPEMRFKTDDDGAPLLDDDGKEIEYDYAPAYFIITNMSGKSYKVYVGDLTLSGSGYYVKLDNFDRVYILTASIQISDQFKMGLGETVMKPIEAYVNAMLVYPSSLNTCFNVENFTVLAHTDYDKVFFAMGEIYPDGFPEGEELEFAKLYESLVLKYSKIYCNADYIPLDKREYTMYSYRPYVNRSEYLKGYNVNDRNIDTVLQSLIQMKYKNILKLSPTEEELDAFGLSYPEFRMSYYYLLTDQDGRYVYEVDEKGNYLLDSEGKRIIVKIPNEIAISALTEDNTYLAYSPYFETVVEIERSELYYLEWTEFDWYMHDLYMFSVEFLENIIVSSPEINVNFRVECEGEKDDRDIKNVYMDNSLLDYEFKYYTTTGREETGDAVINFKRFCKSLLYASIEGILELDEDALAEYRAKPDSECQLIITIMSDDKQGNTEYLKYRYYRVSERKSYVTVEVLDSPDAPSDGKNATGIFYCIGSYPDKLINDAIRVKDGVGVVYTSKD